MYDDSAGAMYEQEEYARKEALRKKKILRTKNQTKRINTSKTVVLLNRKDINYK